MGFSEQAACSYQRVRGSSCAPTGQGGGQDQVVMLAFAGCAIGVVSLERYFDAHVGQLRGQRFRFGEMAADFDFSTLEENE